MTSLSATIALGLALIALPACSSTEGPPPDVATGAAVTVTPSARPSSSSPTAAEATAAADSLAPDGIGLGGMVLTSPTESNGPRPDLTWEPVDGARYYSVVVSTAEGKPYWAWEGDETSVPLGGHPRLEDHAAGPRLTPGMTWVVAARDADHHVIAVSGRQRLNP